MAQRSINFYFAPYAAGRTDFDCPDGEILATDAHFSCSGCLTAPLSLNPLAPIDHGEIIARHLGNFIILSDDTLYWCSEFDNVYICDVRRIGRIGTINDVAISGGNVVLSTPDGIVYVEWTGDGYHMFEACPTMPEIEFGMVEKGRLSSSDTVSTEGVSLSTGATGTGASTMHPSASHEVAANKGAHSAIMGIFNGAIASQAHGRGYFTSPVLVRYGLRDNDNNILCISPPILLTPDILPPCIALTNVSDDAARVDLSACRYFELRYRITQALEQQWQQHIRSIDIFISRPIDTFTPDACGYATSYLRLISQMSDGTSARGREHGSTQPRIYQGTYSTDGATYAHHCLTDSLLHSTVWHVSPNLHICSDICNAHDYHLVASIPVRNAFESRHFERVGIESITPEALSQCPKLSPDADCLRLASPALHSLGSRIVAGGGEVITPAPPGLQGEFRGDVGDQPEHTAEITVYLRHSSQVAMARSVCCITVDDVTQALPRLYTYGSRKAFLMQIRCNGASYQLPLTPHPTLDLAYWFGGLDADYAPMPFPTQSGLYAPDSVISKMPTPNTLYLSAGNIHHFTESRSYRVGTDTITSVKTAIKAPGESNFGNFPLYVFTTQGIWLMRYDAATATISGAALIAPDCVMNPQLTAPTATGVAYVSHQSLKHVSGASVKTLHCIRSPSAPDLSIYPRMLELTEFQKLSTHQAVDLSHCGIIYDATFDAVIAYSLTSPSALIYNMASGAADSALWSIRHGITTLDSALLQMADGTVASLTESKTPMPITLITRMIKLGSQYSARHLKSVSIWGNTHPRSIHTLIYGCNHPGLWHLIGSSRSHKVEIAGTQAYTFYAVAVIANLKPGEYLHGAQFTLA